MILARFNTTRSTPRARRGVARPVRHPGFTLTELLVVIGIVVLLIGILLAALGSVRSKALTSKTEALMSGFGQAAETYQLEHNTFPGIVPDRVLAALPDQQITGTESAVLALMGGYRVLSPTDVGTPVEDDYDQFAMDSGTEEIVANINGQEWKIAINPNRIGEGPYVKGRTYSPYFTPKESEVAATQGVQTNEADDGSIEGMPANFRLPDLLDGWGQPIVFARRIRSQGPLVGDSAAVPQYLYDTGANSLVGTSQYTQSDKLGELETNQTSSNSNEQYSILNLGSATEKQETWAQILAHPALPGEARGAFTLLSAGSDGIFFSRMDGPGSPNEVIGVDITIADLRQRGPSEVEKFDDVRVFGGN